MCFNSDEVFWFKHETSQVSALSICKLEKFDKANNSQPNGNHFNCHLNKESADF